MQRKLGAAKSTPQQPAAPQPPAAPQQPASPQQSYAPQPPATPQDQQTVVQSEDSSVPIYTDMQSGAEMVEDKITTGLHSPKSDLQLCRYYKYTDLKLKIWSNV